ncbi:DUF2752 domain-containing protein [Croceiramulus getboli]|nr:DUF2752 domain-containing protein [Flavobacteriaceae bacterium YJPT1-3]
MLPCLNKSLFGVDCLGCGLQRASLLFIQGDFVGAFYMYPGLYPLMLLVGFLSLNFFVSFKYQRVVKIALIVITVLTVVISYMVKMNQIIHLTTNN